MLEAVDVAHDVPYLGAKVQALDEVVFPPDLLLADLILWLLHLLLGLLVE